jgi:hypothetical protein
MNPRNPRDVPKGAAMTIVALVLLASVVMGREDPAPRAESQGPYGEGTAPAASDQVSLDIALLRRARAKAPAADVFALPRPPSPPAAAVAAVPKPPPARPAPSAPPLPFRYLGRMTQGAQTLLIVAEGQDAYSALPGETIDERYRLERMNEKSATFVYLPTGVKQTLALPPRE